MPHIEGRIVHDADAHVMEPGHWLDEFVDSAIRDDLIGVPSQLVFPTDLNVLLEQLEQGYDPDLLYGTAAATNRAQVEFCSVSDRLLAAGYAPLASEPWPRR